MVQFLVNSFQNIGKVVIFPSVGESNILSR